LLCGFLLLNPFLFGGPSGGFLGFNFARTITGSPLNLVRQFDKEYLRNFAMKLDHDAICFNAVDRRVLFLCR
jgi:hypothetical protein